ncbi:uncharacterized protein C8Q71DRAFT_787945 [Rhodofomes roseus]|uniref:Secreted protein n=1 Tax=Rhodofomes roseus TaxID=34475 RepID=A0ABQ8K0J1_9APHY|nr:uncharacterized protein C8Q71DRAFT_787945 [Rhodofomes roseus]KAH9829937.1 hypothetical protein C8Q71DRAFT_787945 [Rhodofomes roseus]
MRGRAIASILYPTIFQFFCGARVQCVRPSSSLAWERKYNTDSATADAHSAQRKINLLFVLCKYHLRNKRLIGAMHMLQCHLDQPRGLTITVNAVRAAIEVRRCLEAESGAPKVAFSATIYLDSLSTICLVDAVKMIPRPRFYIPLLCRTPSPVSNCQP